MSSSRFRRRSRSARSGIAFLRTSSFYSRQYLLLEQAQAFPPELGSHAAHQRVQDDAAGLLGELHALVRGEYLVGGAALHVVDGLCFDVHLRALIGRLPRGIRL